MFFGGCNYERATQEVGVDISQRCLVCPLGGREGLGGIAEGVQVSGITTLVSRQAPILLCRSRVAP